MAFPARASRDALSQINVMPLVDALQEIQPALYIDAADGASHEVVASVLSSAKSNGMASINFIGRR